MLAFDLLSRARLSHKNTHYSSLIKRLAMPLYHAPSFPHHFFLLLDLTLLPAADPLETTLLALDEPLTVSSCLFYANVSH